MERESKAWEGTRAACRAEDDPEDEGGAEGEGEAPEQRRGSRRLLPVVVGLEAAHAQRTPEPCPL